MIIQIMIWQLKHVRFQFLKHKFLMKNATWLSASTVSAIGIEILRGVRNKNVIISSIQWIIYESSRCAEVLIIRPVTSIINSSRWMRCRQWKLWNEVCCRQTSNSVSPPWIPKVYFQDEIPPNGCRSNNIYFHYMRKNIY